MTELQDDLRPKCTVELTCTVCGWSSWFGAISPEVLQAAETGSFTCDNCKGMEEPKTLKKG